jgi:uncharacterized protein YjbI with pentapeptide repeats
VSTRRDVDATWRHLEGIGIRMPRDQTGARFVLPRMPCVDDEESDDEESVGLCFFRDYQSEADFRDLTLPRTFFGRSLLERVCFANSDLTESRMCWNDFVSCDFRKADMARCDLRASIFEACDFAGANLRGADLRRARFNRCRFTNTQLASAIAEDVNSNLIDSLSDDQLASMDLRPDGGPEPEGG